MDQIVPLPEPLSEPLPMFTLGPPIVWWQLAFACLLAWAAWRWLIKQRPVPPRVSMSGIGSTQATGPAVPRSDFVTKLFEIERVFLESKDYREGCHALASLVRTYLEKQVNQEVEALTALEISTAFKDPRVGRFATELRDAQYGREHPTRDLFRRLCREAKALFGGDEKFEFRRHG